MTVRRATAKPGAVKVVDLPRSAVIEDVKAEARRAGMSLERFIELGRVGEAR